MMRKSTSGLMPPTVTIALWAVGGFAVTAALLLWLERGPAILLDLSALSSRFICF
jgi:hypothetical protein